MINSDAKTLMRSGHRNGIDTQRVLFYHLMSINKFLKLKSNNVTPIVEEMFNKKFYVIKVDNKYVHIEKDETIYLTNYPTCFYETDIFEDNEYKFFGENLLKDIKKSSFYDETLNIEYEVVSKSKIKAIAEMKVL